MDPADKKDSGNSTSTRNPSGRILIEVCVASLQAAIDAEAAGADRLELNLALELDGLTPSAGLFTSVSSAIKIPVIAMARPRGGDFFYSESEWETLIADARWLLDQGVAGIAFGCLDSGGRVDRQRCRQMRALAGKRELVFHKAFDVVDGWERGLDELIETGIDRVMTSGQAATASDGIGLISRMVEYAGNRMEVLPAGRISSGNAANIVTKTGCSQLHGSFSSSKEHDIPAEIGLSIRNLASRTTPS